MSWVLMHDRQRFADWRWAGFLVQMFVRRTELSVTTKLSNGDETPPIANVLLPVVFMPIILSNLCHSLI